jgi:hypothetical protein
VTPGKPLPRLQHFGVLCRVDARQSSWLGFQLTRVNRSGEGALRRFPAQESALSPPSYSWIAWGTLGRSPVETSAKRSHLHRDVRQNRDGGGLGPT